MKQLTMNSGVTPETLAHMFGRILMGRVGEPEEVLEIIVSIASKACQLASGLTLNASGGRAT